MQTQSSVDHRTRLPSSVGQDGRLLGAAHAPGNGDVERLRGLVRFSQGRDSRDVVHLQFVESVAALVAPTPAVRPLERVQGGGGQGPLQDLAPVLLGQAFEVAALHVALPRSRAV